MQEGTVKFFNEAKGFGFITPADGSKDIFVHSSGLNTRSVRENDKVVFDVQKEISTSRFTGRSTAKQ